MSIIKLNVYYIYNFTIIVINLMTSNSVHNLLIIIKKIDESMVSDRKFNLDRTF